MSDILHVNKHYLFIVLALLLFYNTAHSQQQKIIDSLLLITKTTTNDSLLMDAYNKLRRATYYNDGEKSRAYTQQFLHYATKRKDSGHIAIANFYMGNSYFKASELDLAITFYLKSVKYYELKNDRQRLSSMYNAIGAVYEKKDELNAAITYYKNAAKLSNETNDRRREAIALVNLSNVYQNQSEFEEATRIIEIAIDITNELRNEIPSEIPKTQSLYLMLQLNLASLLLKQNKQKSSKEIYLNILQEVDSSKNKVIYAHALKGLGSIYNWSGDTKIAENYLINSFQIFSENNFVEYQLEILPELIDTYKENNKNEKALSLFYTYNHLKDSIFNNQKDINLNNALQKYEAIKKDKEIADKEQSISEEISKKKNVIIGLISFATIALLIIISLRKRLQYENKLAEQTEAIQKQEITELQQKNKLLALSSMIEGQEAERLRISKDLHDSLGGLLSTIKAHFTTIQNEIQELDKLNITNKTNSLIDEACVEVRRISHNMIPHALSISGLKAAIEDLGEHLNEQGYKTTIEASYIPEELDATKSVMMYRLVQEITSNIRKHSEAHTILIQIIGFQNEMNLVIEDDGKGFDYETAINNGGLGIKSINSRVQFLDGTIDWNTQPNNGTSITINIPNI